MIAEGVVDMQSCANKETSGRARDLRNGKCKVEHGVGREDKKLLLTPLADPRILGCFRSRD